MEMYRTFRNEDIVKLTSGQYGDARWNPIWGGEHGKIKGTVKGNPTYRTTNVCCITVLWKNGQSNTYTHDDLVLIEDPWINDEDFIL